MVCGTDAVPPANAKFVNHGVLVRWPVPVTLKLPYSVSVVVAIPDATSITPLPLTLRLPLMVSELPLASSKVPLCTDKL